VSTSQRAGQNHHDYGGSERDDHCNAQAGVIGGDADQRRSND
jgi:hypothetical protein